MVRFKLITLFILASLFASGQDNPVSVTGKLAIKNLRLHYWNGTSWVAVADSSAVASGSFAPTTRNINTQAPVTGGGDLSADRTIALSINAATEDTANIVDEILFGDTDNDNAVRKSTIEHLFHLYTKEHKRRYAYDYFNEFVNTGYTSGSYDVVVKNQTTNRLELVSSSTFADSAGGYTPQGITAISATVSSTSGEIVLLVDATTAGGTVNISIPGASGNSAKISVKKIDSSDFPVNVNASGSDTIDGATSQQILFQNTCMTIIAYNSNWYRIS